MKWNETLPFEDTPHTGRMRGVLSALKLSYKSMLARTCNFLRTRSRPLGFSPWRSGNRSCKRLPGKLRKCRLSS